MLAPLLAMAHPLSAAIGAAVRVASTTRRASGSRCSRVIQVARCLRAANLYNDAMRSRIALVAALVVVALGGGRARGDDAKLARQHFEDGSRLYDLGKYREAAREYEEAYKLQAGPGAAVQHRAGLSRRGRHERRADGVQVVSAAHAGRAEPRRGRGATSSRLQRQLDDEQARGRGAAAQARRAAARAAATAADARPDLVTTTTRRRRPTSRSTRSGGCGPRSAACSSPAAWSRSRWRDDAEGRRVAAQHLRRELAMMRSRALAMLAALAGCAPGKSIVTVTVDGDASAPIGPIDHFVVSVSDAAGKSADVSVPVNATDPAGRHLLAALRRQREGDGARRPRRRRRRRRTPSAAPPTT